jgi:hypothetical protein
MQALMSMSRSEMREEADERSKPKHDIDPEYDPLYWTITDCRNQPGGRIITSWNSNQALREMPDPQCGEFNQLLITAKDSGDPLDQIAVYKWLDAYMTKYWADMKIHLEEMADDFMYGDCEDSFEDGFGR